MHIHITDSRKGKAYKAVAPPDFKSTSKDINFYNRYIVSKLTPPDFTIFFLSQSFTYVPIILSRIFLELSLNLFPCLYLLLYICDLILEN